MWSSWRPRPRRSSRSRRRRRSSRTPPRRPRSRPSFNLAAVQATLVRLEADLRALAKLARSAELPPAAWVDRAELTALRRLDEARAQLGTNVENAA